MLIQFTDITYKYPGSDRILSPQSGEVDTSGILVLSGPSGSGKTTLLQLLWRIHTPTSGTMIWDPRLTYDRAIGFGYAFVGGPFFEDFSVRDNIHILEIFSRIEIDATYYRHLLQSLELTDLEHTPLKKLSVWQRERVGIARALAHQPLVVIIDEPGSNLDERLFEVVYSLILDTAEERGTAFCIASHHPGYLDRATDRIFL